MTTDKAVPSSVSDTLGSGPRLKVLTVVDHFSRVSPAIEAETSLPARRVIKVLERAAERYGLPQMLCVDPPTGHPDNAMIETFNAKVRAECLDQHWFSSLEEAKKEIEAWRQDYNEQRPHGSLGNQTPAQFLAHWQQQQNPRKAPDLSTE